MYTLAANYLTQRRRDAEAQRRQETIEPHAKWWLSVVAVLGMTGMAVGWNLGQLPVRECGALR